MMTKQCIKCDEKKDVVLFRKIYQYWTTKDGINHKSITKGNVCLDCFNLLRRKYNKKNPRKYTKVDIRANRKYFKKCLKNLSDSYIKALLVKNSSLSTKDITNDLIEMKREQVKLLRILKIGRCAAKSRA